MGKVLLITGAGGGLGSLVALHEASNFSEMILLDRQKEPLEKLARAVGSSNPVTVHVRVADVSNESQLQTALSSFDTVDGLVNAAGILGPVAKFGDDEWSAWKEAVTVNLIGNVAVCRFVLPKLIKSRRGKIVNFSGGGAAGIRIWHSAYATAKAGMVKFTEILAAENPQIDANAIAPGAHNTGIWKTETHDQPPAKWADKPRFCDTVSFLLSEKSDGISGKLVHIYDKWEEFKPDTTKGEIYTLRRIEPKR